VLFRSEAVQAQLVLLGIDCDRLLPKLVCRPHHADRNLTSVRYKNLPEHQSPHVRSPGILFMLRCSASTHCDGFVTWICHVSGGCERTPATAAAILLRKCRR